MRSEVSFLPPFLPTDTPARWAVIALLASLAIAWIAVGVELSHLRLLHQAASGRRIVLEIREAQEQTSLILLWAQGIGFALTGIAFCTWLMHARVNLRAMGVRRLRFDRSWTVKSFLIPFMNTFRPYQVMREIWQASDPLNLDAFNWRSRPVPWLLGAWWAAFVAFLALTLLAIVTELTAGVTIPQLQISAIVWLAADATAALAACLGCFVVSRISDAQERKRAAQDALDDDAAAEPA